MTVGELIDQLQKLDIDATVISFRFFEYAEYPRVVIR